jgi:hypothetical protein
VAGYPHGRSQAERRLMRALAKKYPRLRTGGTTLVGSDVIYRPSGWRQVIC